MKISIKTIAAASVAAIGLTVGGIAVANGAVKPDCKNLMYPLCARSVADTQVVDNSLSGYKKLAPSSVSEDRLNAATRAKLNDKTGQVTGLESDGPYPSATQLQDGANSTKAFNGDEGVALQRAWVQCAPGKVALSGGFSRADEAVKSIKNLQIVTSAPAQIKDGKVVTIDGGYAPIDGDKDGSFVPNGWVVEGFNNGTADLIVRPHVVCGNVAK